MKRSCLLFVLYFLVGICNAQNLIPNHSFEKVLKVDNYFSSSYYVFNSKISDWTSPTQSSPDIIHEPYIEMMKGGPLLPIRENFFIKPLKPKTGKVFVGIKVYGCDSKNTHCREYLQAKTLEPMKQGSCYEFSYFTNPLTNGSRINNMGVAFSHKLIEDVNKQDVLELDNRYGEKEIISPGLGKWQEIKGTIKAKDAWNYMIIGNFFHDDETKEISSENGYPWGYYLVDEVSLIEVDCDTGNSLSSPPITVIHFESNSSLISESEQKSLQLFLQDKKIDQFSAEIIGHADEDGNHDFNQKLSLQRAQKVKDLLIQYGIKADSIRIKALGENAPVSEFDKSQNRRVEVRLTLKLKTVVR